MVQNFAAQRHLDMYDLQLTIEQPHMNVFFKGRENGPSTRRQHIN